MYVLPGKRLYSDCAREMLYLLWNDSRLGLANTNVDCIRINPAKKYLENIKNLLKP